MNVGKMRIGNGFDVHRFAPGRKLMLGGIEIPCDVGLDGHSDADVLLHAVCDAILGALGERDIGTHFPDTDPKWKNCSSVIFLRECVGIAREQSFQIVNIDSTVLAEKPKIMPHVPSMKKVIAEAAGIAPGCVGIKATTMERLGFVGREEGMAAMAVVLLESTG